MNKIAFFFIIFVSIAHADDPQCYAYFDLGYAESNLFYQLSAAIGLLDQYENNKYRGVKVDFSQENERYYCKNNNGWKYCFKELSVGDTTGELQRIPAYKRAGLSSCLYELSFKRLHELTQRYIEIQPGISEKVAAYQKEFFNDSFVIGVCYMKGNSSQYAVPEISYKTIYDMLLVHIVEKNNLKIFIYTNDQRFYAFLKVKHPDIVFEYKESKCFKIDMNRGEYELINCLLLSQTDFLIRTPSRSGFAISQFNPLVPVVELGESLAKRTE